MNYFQKRKTAFVAAMSGFFAAVKSESHLQIHLFVALIVLNLGFYFSITQTEWFAVLVCITLVISLELVNSALEKLCNLVMPQQHPIIKYVKDVAASAVLVASVLSVIIGVMIFRNHWS